MKTPSTIAYEADMQDRRFFTLPDALDYIRERPAADKKATIIVEAIGEDGSLSELLAPVGILPERQFD